MLRLLLFFQLVFVVNQLHFPWETGIPGVAPANILFLAILLFMRGKQDQITVDKPILQKPMIYFAGAITFSLLWAQLEPNNLLDDLTYYKNALFFPLFYFLYLRCRQDEKTTRWLIICIMAVAALAGVEAIREGFDYGFGKYNAFRRASGPFGTDWHHANRAGVFYGMFAPMFVALALFLRGQKWWRLMAIAGIALLAGGALFTYSRQSYIMLILGASLLLLRRSVVATVIVAITLVSLSGYLPDSVTQRVEETKQQGRGGDTEVDVSTASRWEIWEGAMGMLKDHPIGVGLNRFKSHIGEYSSHKGMDAHNFYVLTIAECGPQGLITLALLFVAMFRLAGFIRKHAPPEDPELHALAIGFTVTTFCVGLGQLYGSPFFEGSVLGPYWALCGLLERYTYLKIAARAGQDTSDGPREASLVERFPLAVYLGKRD